MTTREAVLAEARTWVGTAYHDNAWIKVKRDPAGNIIDAGGVDCVHSIYLIYRACGLVPAVEIPRYSPQFMCHRSEEIYLNRVLRHARQIDNPLPGDLALLRYGRVYSQGAIVDAHGWPKVMHASADARVFIAEPLGSDALKSERRPIFFTVWE